MKTKIIILLVCVFAVSGLSAQLRVLSNGRLQVGLLKESEDPLNVTTLNLLGKYGDMRSGAKLSIGDFGSQPNGGWNVFIGEYGTADTDQLWLHGKSGIYMTTRGDGGNVVAYYNPSANANFVFNTNLRVNGVNITSDTRLKDNINPINKPLSLLSQLTGVTYTYRLSEIQNNRKQDDSKFKETISKDLQLSDSKEFESNSKFSDKANRDKQIQAQVDAKEAEDASRKRIGFLAQDIQKVLPELVQTDEKGVLSIDYIGFIPLIVESLKEMQQTINNQNKIINNLQKLISPEDQLTFRSDATSNEGVQALGGAKLYPRDGASVGYSLPANCNSANLHIFDISGKTVKAMTLNADSDYVEINSSEIGLGTYIYALFVDGQKRDTLKKFVNR